MIAIAVILVIAAGALIYAATIYLEAIYNQDSDE